MPAPRASIYWDLDACGPQGYTADEAVQAIRWRALRAHAGEIRKIRAYSSAEARAEGDSVLLDELRLRSIEVLDTRPVGGPECTVKMMQVDILIEMMDVTKAPPTLLIISDNRSMTYPVSLLRNRLRKVELITSAELTEAVQHVRTAPADPLASLVSTEPSGEALRDDALPIQHAAVALNTAPLSPAQREDGPAIAIPLQSVHLQTAPHQYALSSRHSTPPGSSSGRTKSPNRSWGT